MTLGHKHRTVKVSHVGLAQRVLTKPLIWSDDLERVDRSPYPWGPDKNSDDEWWYLSALSILHRWTGLTLKYEDKDGQ